MINELVLATEPFSSLPVTAIDGTVMLGSAMLILFVTKEVTFASEGNLAIWKKRTNKLSGRPSTATVAADKRRSSDDQRRIGYGGEANWICRSRKIGKRGCEVWNAIRIVERKVAV